MRVPDLNPYAPKVFSDSWRFLTDRSENLYDSYIFRNRPGTDPVDNYAKSLVGLARNVPGRNFLNYLVNPWLVAFLTFLPPKGGGAVYKTAHPPRLGSARARASNNMQEGVK